MTCDEHTNTYNLGQFHALIHSLPLPSLSASSTARRVASAAEKIELTAADAELMLKTAREMEGAAKALREAAEPAFVKPTLLQAAE